MLNISQLSVNFGQKKVLKNLDFSLKKNQISGIIGRNGSGKTTLLNCINQELKPQTGTITFNGNPVKMQEIAFLETNNFFYSRMTGKEYLRFFKLQQINLDRWKEVFDLPLENFISTYSTGMKKKLAFLGILSLNRPILILDEPFNGVDMETNEVLKKIILLLQQQEKTIIVTSHILETLTNICQEIHYLNDGVIQKTFTKDEFSTLPEVFSTLNSENLENLIAQLK